MAGTPFGRYQLERLLGHGGMGQVWSAYDTDTDRRVALKVLPAELAADPVYRERFRREAHTVAAMREPHVVPIHGYGEIEGRLYLDMRLVDGIDVKALLARDGPLPPPRAVTIIEQVAAALDAAHAERLVHRDIKPANILVCANDFVYLVDFGIARAAGESVLTSTGAVVGTFSYMAPERLTTGQADARTDVYALTGVLHECLTGGRPFPGDSYEQQITAHLTAPPPRPSLVRPGVPAGFDEVVARGMGKNPDERYASAGELAAAARAALTSSADTEETVTISGPKLTAPEPESTAPPPPPAPEAAATVRRSDLPAPPPPPAPEAAVTVRRSDLAALIPPPRAAQLPVRASRRRWLPLVVALLSIGAIAIGAIVYWALTERGTRDAGPVTTSRVVGPATIVTATIQVGRSLSGVAVAPGTHTVYTTSPNDGTVSIIDAVSRTVTATIAVGQSPDGIVIDAGTRTIYTANPDHGTVSVIDAVSRIVTATITVGRNPGEVAVDSGTHTVYAANFADSTVSVIDAISRTVTATIPVGQNPDGIAVDQTTHTVYVTNSTNGTVSVLDGTSRTVTATIAVGQGPSRVAVDPVTHTVYVTNYIDRTVSVLDAASRAVTATIAIGTIPFGVAVDPGTHTVYVTNYNDVTVSVLDAASRTVTATIAIGAIPYLVAVDPDTHTVYTSNGGYNTVSVLEPPG